MPQKQTSPLLSRPPLARMQRIHREIEAGRLPNATSLSSAFEVSSKTVGRDIAYMRDQLGLPIEWDAQANGYRYSEHVDGFPTMQVSESELFALLVAQKALKPYENTPFHAPLESALQKLSEGLKDKIFLSLDRLDAPVSFKSFGHSKADMATFQVVSSAVAKQEELHFEYKKIGEERWQKRTVQPWHLCSVENQWYVVCRDLKQRDKRTFALVRMRRPSLTGNKFDTPEDFDIQKHLKGSFGVFVSEKRYKVRVIFDAWAGELIKEKEWHPTQQMTDLEGGEVEMRIELADLFEIERWILSWGNHAKVAAPVELKKRIHAHAQGILENR